MGAGGRSRRGSGRRGASRRWRRRVAGHGVHSSESVRYALGNRADGGGDRDSLSSSVRTLGAVGGIRRAPGDGVYPGSVNRGSRPGRWWRNRVGGNGLCGLLGNGADGRRDGDGLGCGDRSVRAVCDAGRAFRHSLNGRGIDGGSRQLGGASLGMRRFLGRRVRVGGGGGRRRNPGGRLAGVRVVALGRALSLGAADGSLCGAILSGSRWGRRRDVSRGGLAGV